MVLNKPTWCIQTFVILKHNVDHKTNETYLINVSLVEMYHVPHGDKQSSKFVVRNKSIIGVACYTPLIKNVGWKGE